MSLLCFTLIFCAVSVTNVPSPHSTVRPGSPVPVNTNNPGVRKAARFGVYRYNNSSNDLFLFKESQINKAMVQIVRGLKYMLHVEIKRTVCEKRGHSSLDSCHFQREKNLQRVCLQFSWGSQELQGISYTITFRPALPCVHMCTSLSSAEPAGVRPGYHLSCIQGQLLSARS
uniref:Egg-white cystatin n=1 Tax=Cyanistes caeruleus TaxID=156563 RepID=A0A8C0TZP9_CYACU